MVQANELRVGNLVLDEDTPVTIIEITSEYVNHSQAFHCPFNDVVPIPITPEILEACGWKYYKLEGVARLGDDFEETEGDTEYWELGKLTIVSWDKGPLTLSNSSSFDHRIELNHLHQLQNIFYALTGKELTYQPIQK